MTTLGSQTLGDAAVLASNLALIRRRFPEVADLLEGFGGQWPSCIHAELSRSGLPTIAVTGGPTQVHVHSTFQPAVEAERWVREVISREWSFAVVFGVGLGYQLDALLEARPQCRLVVVEPRSDVFYAAMALRDQRRWLSHSYLQLIVADAPALAAQKLFHDHWRDMLEQPTIVSWPATVRYSAEYWKLFESQLLDLVRLMRTDLATRYAFQAQWIDNFFRNLRFALLDPGISSLIGLFRGKPAIIVSAGPSLEKNVHLLAEAKGKAVIIAAGSAINPVRKHGIEPDLLVSFDPTENNYRHFEDLDTPYLPLIYIPTIFPRILEEYRGPRFTAAMDMFPFTSWLFAQLGEDKGLLKSGPSVANVAWHLASVLGLNPIILVGQDLAFTGGKTHADGAVHARTIDLEAGQDGGYITTEGVDGKPVITNLAMYNMKVWFERHLATAGPGLLTIDATEGGAKISGTAIMTLQEALDRYCQERFDPYRLVMDVHAREWKRLQQAAVSNRLANILDPVEQDLSQVARLAAEGLYDARQVLQEASRKRLTEQRYGEALTRLSRFIKQMERLTAYQVFVLPLIEYVMRYVFSPAQARWDKESDLSVRGTAMAEAYIALFSAARDKSKHVQRLIREYVERACIRA